jgi:hypothetical protein
MDNLTDAHLQHIAQCLDIAARAGTPNGLAGAKLSLEIMTELQRIVSARQQAPGLPIAQEATVAEHHIRAAH